MDALISGYDRDTIWIIETCMDLLGSFWIYTYTCMYIYIYIVKVLVIL